MGIWDQRKIQYLCVGTLNSDNEMPAAVSARDKRFVEASEVNAVWKLAALGYQQGSSLCSSEDRTKETSGRPGADMWV